MSAKPRNLAAKIDRLLGFFPAVLVVGVRQCGKTTLVREMRKGWRYFDLERAADFDFISADPDFFFREYPGELIIDEAQEFPGLFRHLRGVIDRDRDRRNRFILTGSSSPELMRMASDSLAGRIGVVELGTFKMNETLGEPLSPFYRIFESELSGDTLGFLAGLDPGRMPGADPLDLFRRGGYPEPVLSGDDEFHAQWMENYFQTYIGRDIRKFFPRLDIVRYRRFVSMLADLSGTVVNKARVGRAIDASEVTVRDYLDIADKTFVWRTVPAYGRATRSAVRSPKGLMRDSGLLHHLAGIGSRERLLRWPGVGWSFESFVIEEIIKGVQATRAARWEYFHFRTKHGAEVDLVLEGEFGLLPIEIKFSSSTSPRGLASLARFISAHGAPFGVVVNNSREVRMLRDDIIQIPLSLI
jgi:predicted AAA+ superfamily ATPase